MESIDPQVYIVGAGPGAPGLLTLRAVEALSRADLVLHDALVPRRLLDFAKPTAELLCIRDLPGIHPDKYPHIHNLLIDRARAGHVVVRLKGGDPLIFGRGGEETAMLREAGIRYEIVPGVTAALAAAAYLDLPLTHRNYASAVAFITGHELPTKLGNRLDYAALARFPGTLVIYMGIARLPMIVAELLKHGKDPMTPAAIVERASTGEMRTIASTLAGLDTARRNAGLEAPGLVILGDAVEHRSTTSWFESTPLFGKRVLITRPRHQALPMLQRLEELGAVTHLLSTMVIRAPRETTALDDAIRNLKRYDWLGFTSVNGVQFFMQRLLSLGYDLRALGSLKLAAIGPATATALSEFHLIADVVPTEFSSEGMVETLSSQVAGKRVLLARANRGRDLLPVELAKIADVEQVVVYEQIDSIDLKDEVFDHLRRGEIEFVTLTSSNIARAFLAACDEIIRGRIHRGELKLVAISGETGGVVRDLGFPIAGEAKVATTEGIVRTLIQMTSEDRGGR